VDPQGGAKEHYGATGLLERVLQALEDADLDHADLQAGQLAALDHFHVRGLAATRELAVALGAGRGDAVLDVGCGLGGPARHLALAHGCRVTGIDLSQAFIDVANALNARAGQAGTIALQCADALKLPFADASFDHAWMLNVAMNIADRGALYGGIQRVLRPGGRLHASRQAILAVNSACRYREFPSPFSTTSFVVPSRSGSSTINPTERLSV